MPTNAPPSAPPADAPAKPGAVSSGQDAAESTEMSTSFAELDALAAEEPDKPPKPAPKKGDPKKAPSKSDDSDLDGLDDDKAPDGKKTDPEPDADPEPEPTKPVKAAELRQAYETTKSTLKQREAELTTVRNELKAAKSTPQQDPEKPVLTAKLQESETRIKALEEKLRLVDYQQSDDFVKTYQKPWHDAWEKAASEVQELMVELEDGQQRPATVNDLVALSQMKLGEARQYAKKMFGEGADDVMAHLRKLRDLSEAQAKALDEAKKNSEATFKRQSEETLKQREKTATLWKDENETWRTKFPKFFAPIDGDEEGNTLLARGYDVVDRAFSSKPANGQPPLTPEEKVKLHAEVRNKAAAFPRLALQYKRARARIAELEKSLAEYEDSAPPSGDGGRTRAAKPSGDGIEDAWAEIDSMAKK